MKSSKSLANGVLWGELPPRETLKQEIITPDLIENVWRQALDDTNNTDCDYRMDRQPEYLQLPMGNLHVLNTINFHQQLRAMEDGTMLGNMSVIESQDSKDTTHSKNPFYFLPFHKSKGDTFKDCSTIHHLTPQAAQSLLKHAVTTLLAHIGFENSSDIAIETLTDVADHFLRRMTLLLKIATEQSNGFPDAMERVLLETGVGGITTLYDYYQEYVLKYEENMKKKVEEMMEKQRQLELNACSTKMVLDEAASKLKFEEDDFGNVYREVPTLQLLDPEMGFPPSLDAGFQMLYNLEQDELNNIEVEEEEVNVSDSPNMGQQSNISVDKKKY